MKISLNWIKDYVSPGVEVSELVERLTMAGTEAEKIERVGGDTVIEFEVTPNRADCLNMIGMAREISAVLKKPLTLPKISARKFPTKKADVAIEAPDACSRYIGTVIEGVKIHSAPSELQKRLTALGNRPISNIVDITNFCLFEIGQPLHAFDLDKLEGNKIVVRFARKGEKITTLDGVERELDPSVLVIADAKKPVALAGVMGGANSEVTASTKNILLESAYFDPILIRRTARKLGLSSDSSYRFERGVVFENVKTGADRALDLILEHAGGTVTAYSDVKGSKGSNPIRRFSKNSTDEAVPRPYKINLDLEKMNSFLGGKVSVAEIKRILKALGFAVTVGCRDTRPCVSTKQNILKVTAPVFRPDIQRSEDLYEEVARVLGYNNLPSSFPCVTLTPMASNQQRQQRLVLTDRLLSQGFNEVLTYSLISADQVEKAGVAEFSTVKVLNPLSKEQEILRPHLLPSLLQVAQTNMNHGQKDLAVFETGKIYPHGGERETLGILMAGCLRSDWRQTETRPFDFFDLKGAIEKTLSPKNYGALTFQISNEGFLEEGQRADIFYARKKIGSCGKVAQSVLEQNGIKEKEIFFAQLDLESTLALSRQQKKFTAVGGFPAIARDVSIAVNKDVLFEQVCGIVRKFGGEHLRLIQFKEEYLGEKISADQRGLVFSVVYQSSEKTLTEEEIQNVHENVLRQLVEQLGAVIR